MYKENIREILIERNIKRASLQKKLNDQDKREPDNGKEKIEEDVETNRKRIEKSFNRVRRLL